VFPAIACISWLIGTSIGYGGDAAPMGGAVERQRILSSRTPKEACKMYVVTEVTIFTLVWLVSVPRLAAVVFWPQLRTGALDRELAYGLLMTNFLGPGLLGLVFVAMLGGIISVVGDNLNFGSQVLLNDIYCRYLVKDASERHYFIAGRLAIFLILALALLVVYKVTFLFDVAIFMVGLSATEMSANWAQWWWWRFNGWGRVAASFGGACIYVAMRLLLWPQMTWWYRMYAAIGITTALWIVTTLATAPERHELLAEFYRRARPIGNWGPVSGEVTGWSTVSKGVGIALLGAAAVMAYIVGVSRLYVGQYWGGAGLLAAMAVLGFAFWRLFDPYIQELMPASQAAEAAPAVANFGLSGLMAVVAFAVAAVFGANALLFLKGGTAAAHSTAAAFAMLTGLWLWRRHKKGEVG
jgi:hypothetical protein